MDLQKEHNFCLLSTSLSYTSHPWMYRFQSAPQMKTISKSHLHCILHVLSDTHTLWFHLLHVCQGLTLLAITLEPDFKSFIFIHLQSLVWFFKSLTIIFDNCWNSAEFDKPLLKLKSLSLSHLCKYFWYYPIARYLSNACFFSNSVYIFRLSAHSLHYSLIR